MPAAGFNRGLGRVWSLLRAEYPIRPRALRKSTDSEEAFRTIAETLPQLLWTARGDGTIDYFNRRWIEYTGVTAASLGASKGYLTGVVHPDELDETWARWRSAIETGTAYEIEHRLRRAADGSYRWFLHRAEPIAGADGTITRWIGTATDIDEQRRARESLRFMVEAGTLSTASLDVATICDTLVQVAVGHFADWCLVTLLQDGGLRTVAMAHKNADLLHYVEQFRDRYPIRPEDALARVVADNVPVLVERLTDADLQARARDEQHLELLHKLQIHSVMMVPLSTPGGSAFGALSMISAESGHLFDQADLAVATAVASRAATAIVNANVFVAERTISQRLRFTARVNELLFEASDLWTTMGRVAATIAGEVADACAVLRLQGDALRTHSIVHRDPRVDAALGGLVGRRALRTEAERTLVSRLLRHETVVWANDGGTRLRDSVWPYLSAEVESLDSATTVVVPLYCGTTTFGALMVFYSECAFDPGRDVELLEEIATRAAIALERAEAHERERRIAATLQQASLPSIIPQPEGIAFDAVYMPAGEGDIGGDWYDAIELDDGSVVVSVGDVTGRGIQAAAIMSKVRHAMGIVPRHAADPKEILDSAEWFLRKRYPEAIVTAFVAIISPDRRTLRYANAGHPFPLLRRNGELIELPALGLPLGLRQLDGAGQTEHLELHEGDVLVLFTDGLTEWNHDIGEGQRCLEGLLRSEAILVSAAPARLIQRACLPNDRAQDDVAILTVSLAKPPDWSFVSEEARAAASARAQFVEFLQGRGADAEFVARAELIFGELLGNAVRHAAGAIEIHLVCSDDATVLHVIDSGPPFGLADGLPSDPLSEEGRGLYIVAQLARNLTVERIGSYGNHVSVTL
ncbi:MAG TPA: SpoIIE family protein phosphatase [Candidatus Baltobacteraceae bacterium]|nr:SpoIIE family protein phosphatase [Candidatus Baltobacteraceae bacterium]